MGKNKVQEKNAEEFLASFTSMQDRLKALENSVERLLENNWMTHMQCYTSGLTKCITEYNQMYLGHRNIQRHRKAAEKHCLNECGFPKEDILRKELDLNSVGTFIIKKLPSISNCFDSSIDLLNDEITNINSSTTKVSEFLNSY